MVAESKMSFIYPEMNETNERETVNKYLLSETGIKSIIKEILSFWHNTLSDLYDNITDSSLANTINSIDKTAYINSRTSIVFTINLALLTIQRDDAKQYAESLLNALKSGNVNYTNYKIAKNRVKDKEQQMIKKYWPKNLYQSIFIESKLYKDIVYSFVYSPCLPLISNITEITSIAYLIDLLIQNLQNEYIESLSDEIIQKTKEVFIIPETVFDIIAILHRIPEFKQAINYWYVRSPYVFDNLAYELVAYTEPFIYYMINSKIQHIKKRFNKYLDIYDTKRLKVHFLLIYGLLRHRFQQSLLSQLETYVTGTESNIRLEILSTYTNLARTLLDTIEQIILTK